MPTVIIPTECNECSKSVTVECQASLGFGYMEFYNYDCPHCGGRNHQQFPGDIVDVRKGDPADA